MNRLSTADAVVVAAALVDLVGHVQADLLADWSTPGFAGGWVTDRNLHAGPLTVERILAAHLLTNARKADQ
jgi:hypothetical protein